MTESLRSFTQLAVRSFVPFLPPWLQSALAGFDKTLDVRPSTIIEERLAEGLEAWRRELRRPLEGIYEPQFLDAQSFTQLLIVVIEATVRERLVEKRRMYGRILARADSPEWGGKVGRVEEILAALIQVSEGDLRVLKPTMVHVKAALEQGAPSREVYLRMSTVSVRFLQEKLSDLDGMAIKTYFTRLERLGLLLPFTERVSGQDSGHYVPTHLLEELIRLLGDDAES